MYIYMYIYTYLHMYIYAFLCSHSSSCVARFKFAGKRFEFVCLIMQIRGSSDDRPWPYHDSRTGAPRDYY